MDPELGAGAVTVVLAMLGLRRRRAADSSTFGQRVADHGRSLSDGAANLLRRTGSAATSITVGAGETVVAGASWLAAGAARTGAAASNEAAALALSTAGRVTAATGGLLIDGALGMGEALVGALRGGARTIDGRSDGAGATSASEP